MPEHQAQIQPGVDVCPWCGAHATTYLYRSAVVVHNLKNRAGQDVDEQQVPQGQTARWRVQIHYCPACGQPFVQVHSYRRTKEKGQSWSDEIVFPRSHGRPPTPVEVPQHVRQDYEEACTVLTMSPQSSAALARRLLQSLLHDHPNVGPKKSLHEEIEAAKAVLPSYLWEQLHLLRTIGNFAAHPMKDSVSGAIQPVEPGEAEFTLAVIEGLFDFLFVAPKRAADAKASANAKLKAAGKKELP